MDNYLKEFELFQIHKQMLHSNDCIDLYDETNDQFIINEGKCNKDDVTQKTLVKRKYAVKKHRLNGLKVELSEKYRRYLVLRSAFLGSRTDNLLKELGDVIDTIEKIEKKIKYVGMKEDEYFVLMKDVKVEKTKPKDENKKKMSSEQKKKVKKYLFDTYEQCISQKTSSPTYMSKADIIAHIKEHDKSLLEHLPTKLEKMKKNDICKVIFS